MSKGWHISLTDKNRMRIFKVGIADQDAATGAVVAQCEKPTGITVLPLKDGEFEKLGMHDGQIIESKEVGR